MRKPAVLILTNGVIVAVVTLLLARSLVQVPQRPQLISSVGSVHVSGDGRGEYAALPENEALKQGDTVRTGPASRAEFRLSDGTRWLLGADSELEIRSAERNALTRAEHTSLYLKGGRLVLRQGSAVMEPSQFEVVTPHVSTAVLGAVLSVNVAHCNTSLAVYRGRTWVQTGPGGAETETGPSPDRLLLVGGQRFRSTVGSKTPSVAPLTAQEFAAYPAYTAPGARIFLSYNTEGQGRLEVQTASADFLRLNGKAVHTRTPGVFLCPVQLKRGLNRWNLQVTDMHGVEKSVPYQYNWRPK